MSFSVFCKIFLYCLFLLLNKWSDDNDDDSHTAAAAVNASFVACLLLTDKAFANSLPERERAKLRLGFSTLVGEWTLWTTTAPDSSSSSDLAVSVVLCGRAGSTAPLLLTDEEPSHADGQRADSSATDRTEITTTRSADLKLFRPSTTDQFVVSDRLLAAVFHRFLSLYKNSILNIKTM